MSGKYVKNKKKKSRWAGVAVIVLILAAACALLAWTLADNAAGQPTGPVVQNDPTAQQTEEPTQQQTEAEGEEPTQEQNDTEEPTVAPETKPVQIEELKEISINLGSGMRITDVGKYTGIYMEDGSDEIVSGVMMIAVTNEGEQAVQYAEISVPVGDEMAYFTLSTLPAGATVILLEQSRMEYVPGEYVTAVAENVALFKEPLDLREDQVKIQNLQGALNISNISDGDIEGDICIYYKNSAADVYYGGITYRVRLEGGLKAGEIKQIVASHFSQSGTAIMFVTCGEA